MGEVRKFPASDQLVADVCEALSDAAAEASREGWTGLIVIGTRTGENGTQLYTFAATENRADLAMSIVDLFKAVDAKTAGGLPARVTVEPPAPRGEG